MKQNIALIVDSGCDLPVSVTGRAGVYVLPVKIGYANELYTDGVDIFAETIYERFPAEIPKTSMPNVDEVCRIAERIKQDGYRQVIAVCMSSGLSGTCQVVKAALSEIEDLESFVFDTKNISIGSGFYGLWVYDRIRAGISFDDIVSVLKSKQADSKVFFYMDTLDYLKAGGRIGRVTGAVATVLGIKPIISCNEAGVYHTVTMIRGKKHSLAKLLESVVSTAENEPVWLAVMHGGAKAEAVEMAKLLKDKVKNGRIIIVEKQITASLAVHTGPGLVGVGVFKL